MTANYCAHVRLTHYTPHRGDWQPHMYELLKSSVSQVNVAFSFALIDNMGGVDHFVLAALLLATMSLNLMSLEVLTTLNSPSFFCQKFGNATTSSTLSYGCSLPIYSALLFRNNTWMLGTISTKKFSQHTGQISMNVLIRRRNWRASLLKSQQHQEQGTLCCATLCSQCAKFTLHCVYAFVG